MRKTLLLVLALLLCLPFFFKKDVNPFPAYDKKEKFDPRLSFLNSVQKLETYTDSIAATNQIAAGSFEYAELLEAVLEQRFYHGFSHFAPAENWIAALSGKFLKEDYACKVQPDKIMQQPNAACSQQALVMMAVLRNKGMAYRSIGFPHHYAMEVLINKEWYFFDANMEPGISKQQRMFSSWKHQNDQLKQYYDSNRFTDLDFKFGKGLTATVGVINEVPGKRISLFHSITGVLSTLAWCLPLLLLFYCPRFKASLPFVSFAVQANRPRLSFSA